MAQKHSCFHIKGPTGRETKQLGDTYDENTSLYYTAPGNQQKVTNARISDNMADTAQDFERKLFSTGGELALKKCFWYLIHWMWSTQQYVQ